MKKKLGPISVVLDCYSVPCVRQFPSKRGRKPIMATCCWTPGETGGLYFCTLYYYVQSLNSSGFMSTRWKKTGGKRKLFVITICCRPSSIMVFSSSLAAERLACLLRAQSIQRIFLSSGSSRPSGMLSALVHLPLRQVEGAVQHLLRTFSNPCFGAKTIYNYGHCSASKA